MIKFCIFTVEVTKKYSTMVIPKIKKFHHLDDTMARFKLRKSPLKYSKIIQRNPVIYVIRKGGINTLPCTKSVSLKKKLIFLKLSDEVEVMAFTCT